MAKYHVAIQATVEQVFEVEANSEDEARELILEGEGEWLRDRDDTICIDTDTNNYSVTKIEGDNHA